MEEQTAKQETSINKPTKKLNFSNILLVALIVSFIPFFLKCFNVLPNQLYSLVSINTGLSCVYIGKTRKEDRKKGGNSLFVLGIIITIVSIGMFVFDIIRFYL